jgi:ParB family transcriptional regulator, chromosome partitioning protein
MSAGPRGMGRGLAAILAVSDEPAGEEGDLRHIPLELIRPNPRQPRRSFDQVSLQALADSVRERGIVQPVLVRPVPGGTYELVAGERRWRAAQLAGMESVPALVRSRDDSAALEVALIENMAREDLNPVEEARACAALTEELGLSREEVGLRVGRSRVAVSNLIRLLDLPDEALEAIQAGDLSEGHGRALLLAPDHGDRRRLARSAAEHGWSVRETENRARGARSDADDGATVRAHRRRPRRLHPDQEAAIAEIGDTFEAVLGREVKVSPSGAGFRAQLEFADAEEALELARSLKLHAPGSSKA